MSKKLPKAISQTIDDLRRGQPDLRDESKGARVSIASVPSPVPSERAGDILAEEARRRRGDKEAVRPKLSIAANAAKKPDAQQSAQERLPRKLGKPKRVPDSGEPG